MTGPRRRLARRGAGFSVPRAAAVLLCATLCATVATCGRKGPLEVPEPNAAPAAAAASVRVIERHALRS